MGGYNCDSHHLSGEWNLFWSRPERGVFPHRIPKRRKSQIAPPVGTNKGPVVEGLRFGTRQGIGLIAYAVPIQIKASVVAVVVADGCVPDIEAGILIGIDIVIKEVVPEDEVVPILVEPYAVRIFRGVIAVDSIELATTGDLQAVEVPFSSVSDHNVIAAVLLQAEADSKAFHDLASGVIQSRIISDVVVVRRGCYQESIVIMIGPVSHQLVVRRIPEREPECVCGEDIILDRAPICRLQEDSTIGVVYDAVIIKHCIAGLFDINGIFFAGGNFAALHF